MNLKIVFRDHSKWFDNYKILINSISFFYKKTFKKKWSKEISEHIKLPEKEIEFYVKKKMLFLYDYQKNKFNYKASVFFLPIFFLYNIFYILKIFLLRKKNRFIEKKFYHLIIENISSQDELNRYGKLAKFYKKKSILVRSLNKNKLNLNNCNFIYKKKYKSYQLDFQDFKFFLIMLFKNFIYSIKHKTNFFYFFLVLIEDFLFFKNFFKEYQSPFMISHQHYFSNNIKNFFLKKTGGKSCLIQKNINAHNETGFFYHTDILFTYGKKVGVNKTFNSIINKKIPMGSFFMEYYNHSKKNNSKLKFDIVCFGCNQVFPGGRYDKTAHHKYDYIDHLMWLKKISYIYPNLKVGFKHHPNNKNSFEYNFFKDTKVKMIDQKLNSYNIGINTKVICSFQSTMIIEMISLGKIAFFLDPNKRNNQFLGDLGNSDNLRIKNFKKFKKEIHSIFFKKNYKKIDGTDYCLRSDDFSQKLFKILNKY